LTTAAASAQRTDCSLKVLPCGEESGFQEDLKDLTVDIYYVAGRVYDTQKGKYVYTPEADYLSMKQALEALGPQQATVEEYTKLSQQAAALALGRRNPVAVIKAGETAKALAPGMYLLIAHGEHENYVLTDQETGAVTTTAYSEKFTYSFSPELVTLPMVDADANAWIYDGVVTLKPQQGTRYGNLEIVKTLNAYQEGEPAYFVFSVEATLGGAVVYSDVVSMTFTAPGQQRVLVEQIPVGAEVTVTEVYSGSCYRLVTDPQQTAVITAEETAGVSFTNTYDGSNKGGKGVTNHFTRETDGWQWSKEA